MKAGAGKKLKILSQIYKRGKGSRSVVDWKVGGACPGLGVRDPAVHIALGKGGENNNMVLRWLRWKYREH